MKQLPPELTISWIFTELVGRRLLSKATSNVLIGDESMDNHYWAKCSDEEIKDAWMILMALAMREAPATFITLLVKGVINSGPLDVNKIESALRALLGADE